MNAISHNGRTICPLRYRMKMSCYYLLQDTKENFPISPNKNASCVCVMLWAVVTARIKAMMRLSHVITSEPHFLIQFMCEAVLYLSF